ncbi:M56 family metallopeptidase [Sporichthya polymorpha]|uniref:M56 family metallopeptidase n=1 Tax=Sporichthya polymorpha TaxID=35751 RepID=UPI000371B6D7|nr:M48 family metalloprotease [Sporichthya polymorpha]
MTTGALLVLWAVVVAVGVPRLLRDAAWPTRCPRLALAAWQAASASFIVSAILAGVALADPDSVSPQAFTHPFLSCAGAVWSALGTPEGAVVVGGGLVLALGVAGRTVWFLSTGLASASRRRRHHGLRLALVAHHDDEIGALVVDHPVPHAYCLPGRNAAIVITSAAVHSLARPELEAVLAHERAHVRARHHLVVVAANGLGNAFFFIPLFRSAAAAVPGLVEMAADDAAARETDAGRVASALLTLAHVPVAGPALAASGGDIALRIRRLLMPTSASAFSLALASLGVVTLLAMPAIAVVIASWASGALVECCTTVALAAR